MTHHDKLFKIKGRYKSCAVLYASLFLFPAMAFAQNGPPILSNDSSVSIGGGVLISPNYLGDDAYSVSTLPFIRITQGTRFFASVQEGAGYSAIKTNRFRAGPLITVEFGRDADGNGPFRVAGAQTNDLIGLGDIDTSIGLGGFADIDFGNLSLSTKASHALGGHKGVRGELALRYKGVLKGYGPPLIYSFGPRLDFGDHTYTQAYFGVSQSQSTASGLAPYLPSGGLTKYGITASGIIPFTQTVSVNIILSYSRLTGDASKAPLVTERGAKDQTFAGLFLARKF